MRVPWSWLKDYVRLGRVRPKRLAERLALSGTEVESIEYEDKNSGEKETIIELEITPNRPDCLGMIGVAREVAALLGEELKKPALKLEETDEKTSSRTSVEILDSQLCPRYTARIIEGVKVGSSPSWMKRRLEQGGVRSINNIVDVTNYVMLETGQPLHAFDYEKLIEGKIIVRRAHPGETLVTLDGIERQLKEDMLVIADARVSVALAGVMGGTFSEVSSSTKTVLLESAYFEAASIMRTSRELGLVSESSNRFEKGVDPEGVVYASNRAADLIAQTAGGRMLQGIIDVYPNPIPPRAINLRTDRLNSILGTDISIEEMIKILESLGLRASPISYNSSYRGYLEVTIPTFRPDLEREIDLVEEVARLYGFHNIQPTLPGSREKQGGLKLEQKRENLIRETLIASGLSECITYSFIDPMVFDQINFSTDDILREAVELKNPVSQEQAIMRTTLLPGLLNVLKSNVDRGQPNVQIFEIGRVFRPEEEDEEGLPREPKMVGALLSGVWHEKEWYGDKKNLDFFDAKGILEILFSTLKIENWKLVRLNYPTFHPGKCAGIIAGDEKLGITGEIHPKVQSCFELPYPVIFFEIYEDLLISKVSSLVPFKEISKYPGVTLDVALILSEDITNTQVEEIIRKEGGKLLETLHLFDVYKGKPISKGKKSLAYSLCYRSFDRTLSSEEVTKIHEKVIKKLKKELSAEIRT